MFDHIVSVFAAMLNPGLLLVSVAITAVMMSVLGILMWIDARSKKS